MFIQTNANIHTLRLTFVPVCGFLDRIRERFDSSGHLDRHSRLETTAETPGTLKDLFSLPSETTLAADCVPFVRIVIAQNIVTQLKNAHEERHQKRKYPNLDL